jgi:hypothetical protein
MTRCLVPYGGLVRGRLAAGETVKCIDHSNRIVSVNPVLTSRHSGNSVV